MQESIEHEKGGRPEVATSSRRDPWLLDAFAADNKPEHGRMGCCKVPLTRSGGFIGCRVGILVENNWLHGRELKYIGSGRRGRALE